VWRTGESEESAPVGVTCLCGKRVTAVDGRSIPIAGTFDGEKIDWSAGFDLDGFVETGITN